MAPSPVSKEDKCEHLYAIALSFLVGSFPMDFQRKNEKIIFIVTFSLYTLAYIKNKILMPTLKRNIYSVYQEASSQKVTKETSRGKDMKEPRWCSG